MSYIRTVPEAGAKGQLAALYRRYANPDGKVDNVLKVHSSNPAALEAHARLYIQSMHRSSPLTRIEREIIAIAVSRINGCDY